MRSTRSNNKLALVAAAGLPAAARRRGAIGHIRRQDAALPRYEPLAAHSAADANMMEDAAPKAASKATVEQTYVNGQADAARAHSRSSPLQGASTNCLLYSKTGFLKTLE